MTELITDIVISAKDCGIELSGTLDALPWSCARSVVVVDGGSSDQSASIARDRGCIVLRETRGGYGMRCQRAIRHLESLPRSPDIVVFLRPNSLSDPKEIPRLISGISEEGHDLVLAVAEEYKPDVRDRLAITVMDTVFGQKFKTIRSLRSIRFQALVALGLSDSGDGWDVEMQIKATRLELSIAEIQVATQKHQRKRRLSWNSIGRTYYQILRHSTRR